MTPTEAIEKLDELSAGGHGGALTDIADVMRSLEADARLGRHWQENSSLEEWFPFTAEELERLRVNNRRLTEACKLVLLFHLGSPWTKEKQAQWWNGLNATMGEDRENSNEATTKQLCDAVRAALENK